MMSSTGERKPREARACGREEEANPEGELGERAHCALWLAGYISGGGGRGSHTIRPKRPTVYTRFQSMCHQSITLHKIVGYIHH